ncbi:hypothetical protein [Vibrio phage phiKT1028]|nr:hypothetical protein [Vibrio phage phiKT1028]
MPLSNDIESPVFRELYQHLNKQEYQLKDFEDPHLKSELQEQLTGDLFEIFRPHVMKRPDLQEKYQTADLRVHVHLTPYEVRCCVKPVVVELAHDLMQDSLPDYSKLRDSFSK